MSSTQETSVNIFLILNCNRNFSLEMLGYFDNEILNESIFILRHLIFLLVRLGREPVFADEYPFLPLSQNDPCLP